MRNLQRERLVHWVKSSKEDLLSFPREVVRNFGFALSAVQFGATPAHAKQWKGLGPGVYEIVQDDGNAYRLVYTVRFRKAIYVLHCFQKKSKAGSSTPRAEIALIRSRFRDACSLYKEVYGTDS